MTPNQFRDRLRRMLDDQSNLPNRAGVFWDDIDLNRELDASQLIVVSALYEAGSIWNIQGLITRETHINMASEVESFPLPNDYMFPIAATINNDACRMHMAGVGTVYQEYDHYGCNISGSNMVFIGGQGKDGIFKYIRKPTSFSLNPARDRTELTAMAYTAILWHAASALSLKDEGNSRYMQRFMLTIEAIMKETATQKFFFSEGVM